MYLPQYRFESYSPEYSTTIRQVPELMLERSTPLDYFGAQNPPNTPVPEVEQTQSNLETARSSLPTINFYIGVPVNGILGSSSLIQTPQPQPAPVPTGLLQPGLTTSGVLPLPPLPAPIANPNGPESSNNKSKLCNWWRGNSTAERSYICYGFALCAFVMAIITLAVVPTVLNKKLT